MANETLRQFQADVRHRLRHFLWDAKNRKAARAQAIRRIIERGWRSCLFGGVVRDVVVKSPWVETRDIDIVVADVSVNELNDAFSDVVVRQTRFGGLTLNIQGWIFDIWPLHTTWGSQFFPLFANTFAILPKTTFFSIEAIAVELQAVSGVPRVIYQERFVQSVNERKIMLNLPENPYPELCIVRAFALAKKLDFGLDTTLVRHLAGWAKRLSIRKIEKAMASHYGRPVFYPDQLLALIRQLREHADAGIDSPLRIAWYEQMEFSYEAPEPLDHLLSECLNEDGESPVGWSVT
jgi:hypothetical protein